MNKVQFLAFGLACCLPAGLAAEDPSESETFLGTMEVLVMEEAAPLTQEAPCVHALARSECMTFTRAVLTVHMQRVPVLRERGRWM